ncbi:MAG: response regulator transcription factor [Terriglobales bacterium]
MRQLIFVVDEIEGCDTARDCLEAAGYEVHTFSTSEMIAEAESSRPALMLISLLLPDGSGISLCRRIRENSVLARTPLLFLLGDTTEEHRILALESGGDDCIVKPFSPRELVARVQAVLRRFSPELPFSGAASSDFVIDSSAMRLSVRGAEIPTTSLEFRLIEYLAQHRGQVFTRDLLLDAVWGDMQFVTPRSVDACIRRVREKIEPDRSRPTYLKTIRGVGYRLDAVPVWRSSPNESCDCAVCARPAGSARLSPSSTSKRRTGSAHARS